jgi:hypothetical protein
MFSDLTGRFPAIAMDAYGTKHLQQVVTFLIGRRVLAFLDMTIDNGPKAETHGFNI